MFFRRTLGINSGVTMLQKIHCSRVDLSCEISSSYADFPTNHGAPSPGFRFSAKKIVWPGFQGQCYPVRFNCGLKDKTKLITFQNLQAVRVVKKNKLQFKMI